MTSIRPSAKAARMTKIHCQPMVVATSPPIDGANNGETLSTRISSENFGALAHRKEVAHHGDGADLRDAAAKRLQQPEGDEHSRRTHRDATQRSDGEQA